MPYHSINTSPTAPAIEQCCLTKLDKRFVILVQFALLVLSFNLLGAFHFSYVGIVISSSIASLFMLRGQQIWAFALAKLLALVLLITYGFDVLAHIPLSPLPTLSVEAVSTSLILCEVLGVWLTAMLFSNLRTVPIGTLFHINPSHS